MFEKISRTKFLCQLIQEKWSKQGKYVEESDVISI